jgi:hypothetical protein
MSPRRPTDWTVRFAVADVSDHFGSSRFVGSPFTSCRMGAGGTVSTRRGSNQRDTDVALTPVALIRGSVWREVGDCVVRGVGVATACPASGDEP